MSAVNGSRYDAQKVADIIRDAGGEIVGRTRLQKIAYLLEITKLGSGFSFEYRHYGPFSEGLANGVASACLWDLITEEERTAQWGGSYSIFNTAQSGPSPKVDAARKQILELGVKANPISLELAATAAFLEKEGASDPWKETARRKPEKAAKWLSAAKELYAKLRLVETPESLPAI